MPATEDFVSSDIHQQYTCLYTFRTLDYLPSLFGKTTVPEPSTKHLVVLALLSILVALTILGNCLICVAAATYRHLRHRSNVFFVSLAITSLLYATSVMTFSITYNIFQPTLFTDTICITFHTLDLMFCASSILHLVAIAFDRLIHISSPLTYSRTCTTKIHFAVIFVLWFIGVLLAFIPQLLGCGGYWSSKNHCSQVPHKMTHNNASCDNAFMPLKSLDHLCYHKSKLLCALIQAVFSFLIPLFTMVLVYSRLFLLTRKHLAQIKNHNRTSNGSLKPDEKPLDIINQSMNLSLNGCASTSSLRSNFFVDPGDETPRTSRYLTDLSSFQDPLTFERRYTMSVARPKPRHCRSELDTRELANPSSKTYLYPRQRSSLVVPPRSLSRRHSENSRCLVPVGMKLKVCSVSTSARSYKSLQSEYKAAVTLGLILGSFLLCWLPMFLLNSISALCDCIRKDLFFAATWLGYSNACVNPIIYSVLNSKFRRACIKLLCSCWRPKEKDEQYGLAKLRFTGNTTIQLALGPVAWTNRELNAPLPKNSLNTNREIKEPDL